MYAADLRPGAWLPGDGNANDIQGNNDGTVQNGATFAPGMVVQAFSFDGTDASVRVPSATNFLLGTGEVVLDPDPRAAAAIAGDEGARA